MKKRLFTALMLAAILSPVYAQDKLDAATAQYLSMSASATEAASRSGEVRALPSAVEAGKSKTFILTLSDASVADRLLSEGYDILNNRDELALATLDANDIEALLADAGVVAISSAYEAVPYMANARKTNGVSDVAAGTGLPQAYDGAGVVCSMMDTGFDPNHVNFQDGNGNTRISRMWVITGNNSSVREYNTPDQIKSYTTDNSNQTHGTHVLGIMAGSFDGNGRVAKYNDRTGRIQISTNSSIPYYGVAPAAELAPSIGTLDGENILRACDKIIDYAKSVGKPAVMNLSLGHNTGPHDGSTAANRYMAKMGEEMIICVSAGNEGGTAISYEKTFSASDNVIRSFVSSTPVANGTLDIWSSDATPVKVTFAAVNKTNGDVVYSYVAPSSASVYITGSYYTASGYIHDTAFDNAFGARGAVIMTSRLNPDNNRYNVLVNFQTERGANNPNDAVVPAVFVEGTNGKTAYLFCGSNGITLRNNGVAGYVNGTDANTINDMACADNIISVGAFVNQKVFPTLAGERQFNAGTKDDIAPFSSYGTRFDGTKLPIIAGPGMGMISSYSHYYMQANTGEQTTASASVTRGSHTSWWAEMSGTSMSSPFVAGVMALWLQADPTLTIGEVKEILKATAKQDEFTAAAPHRFGYGKIDALAGIKHILGTGGVADVKVDGEVLVSEVSRGCFDVFAAGAQQVDAALYGLNGAQVAAVSAKGDTATLTTDGLASGVYVLRAQAGAQTVTRKVVVR
ncbi:MAG: S8 family peptidase [Muribaculaceae bacterium]|nr:S8 family peptidase [Muribaculaceae bacterium]